jgi:hypothetical protein
MRTGKMSKRLFFSLPAGTYIASGVFGVGGPKFMCRAHRYLGGRERQWRSMVKERVDQRNFLVFEEGDEDVKWFLKVRRSTMRRRRLARRNEDG